MKLLKLQLGFISHFLVIVPKNGLEVWLEHRVSDEHMTKSVFSFCVAKEGLLLTCHGEIPMLV